MAQQYRAIVIGCGAVGAASAYWLSRRLGGGVLALEQYQHGHSRGASEDHSRVIRHAYSRPEYTALTPAAYQSWNIAERGTGLQLVYRTGGLILAEDGGAGAAYLAAAAAAMDAANLPFEQLTGTEVMRRWPQWRLGSEHIALHDPESGILDIRRATAAHIALARDDGLYYGFPVYGEVATKIGIDGAGPVVTPQTRTFARDEARVRRMRAFLERYLPQAVGPELYTRTCCYDFPPDRDFIIDYVPGSQRVLVCAGAGHAGKFAALIGRIITELALDGSSRFPVSAFSATRPALTSAAAAPTRVNSL